MAGNTIKFLIEMRDGASKPLKDVGNAAENASNKGNNATTTFTELASKLTLMGMAASAASKIVSAFTKSFSAVTKGGIAAGAQMEGFETRLKVLMGSSAAAKERLDELFQIGSTTPFELPGLIEAEVNLRALGVNAEKTLPMVMDFAGAMGVDLASAAVEVGRAMQFGAGAVETISGRALRAQVELRTGADALKMSTEEFREAMVRTLTDPEGIFAGGTEKLAATFDGMLSNLQDAFFKFKKDVGDAGLFDTAKETLRAMLELIDQNADGLRVMANVISDGIVRGLFGSLKLAGLLLDSFLAAGAAIMQIAQKYTEVVLAFSDVLSGTPLGNTKEEQEALEKRLATLTDTKEELIAIGGFSSQAEDLVSKIEHRVSKLDKRRSGGGRATVDAPAKAVETALSKAKEDTGPTAEELEESMRAALLGTEAALKESLVSLRDLQYKLSPAGLAEGLVNKLTDSFGALTTMMGPAGGLVQSLSIMGQEGSEKIVKQLKDSINGVIVGLVELLPDLLVEIPRTLIDSFTLLIEGIFKAIPKLVEAILIGLPVAVAKGLARWFRMAIKTIEAIFFPNKEKREERKERRRQVADELLAGDIGFKEAFQRFFNKGKKHTGVSHIDRTGAFLLQAGEAVIPNSGTTTQGMDRRMGRRGGMNVTINTNVVDQNSIRSLGKLLEKEFGSMGRSTSPVFNSPTGTTG